MIRILVICAILVALINTEPQHFQSYSPYWNPYQKYFSPRYPVYQNEYYNNNYDPAHSVSDENGYSNDFFRSGVNHRPQPDYLNNNQDSRFLLPNNPFLNPFNIPSLFNIVISTSFITSTQTSTTICTTSTAALQACVSGRRRRDINPLLTSEDDQPEEDILPIANSAVEEKEKTRDERQIHFDDLLKTNFIQPSISSTSFFRSADPSVLNKDTNNDANLYRSGRFLFSFSVATKTTTTTSTLISTVTAICSSTTNFQTCGSSG